MGDTVGKLNTLDSAKYDGVIEPIYGGAPPKEAWKFSFPTIVEIHVAGVVKQKGNFGRTGDTASFGPLGYYNATEPLYTAKMALGSWTPDSLTQTLKIAGTVRASRQPALPQLTGDATHCGVPGPVGPCWTWSGDAHLDFVRLSSTLTTSATTTGPVAPGTAVTFTDAATPATIRGLAVDLSNPTWAWLSDFPNTGDTVACSSAASTTCTRTMTKSGRMYATAYVNGKQDEKWIRVEVSGQSAPPPRSCMDALTIGGARFAPGGDPIKTKYPALTSAAAESLFKALWEKTNYAPDLGPDMRRERAGFIVRDTLTGKYSLIEPMSSLVTSCDVAGKVKWNRGTVLVAWVHTHPNELTEDMAKTCVTDPKPYEGLPSDEDRGTQESLAKRFPDLVGVILDQSGMTVYKKGTVDDRIERCGY